MHSPAMQKLVAEQIAYEGIIQGICRWRPDLQPGEVKAQIQRLAEADIYTHYQWAESCQMRARKGEPLPWEASASE
ncbi:hypothetical protein [Pseudomonas sp. Au-Pse12]|uniref:hypothetical protein n=1 Tax=Pseudomonas sp. Au-Pse12 TaxID=2906459 RepID=UPI001E302767|nr:hypothetical protein [Pseudomonas sp. Au-Pse12]MCE4058476.1 hypothetical protein [Pseudomonas sp. Au-Pse12]